MNNDKALWIIFKRSKKKPHLASNKHRFEFDDVHNIQNDIQTIQIRDLLYNEIGLWLKNFTRTKKETRNRINGIIRDAKQTFIYRTHHSEMMKLFEYISYYCRSNDIERYIKPRDLLAEIERTRALSRFCKVYWWKRHFTVSSRYSRRDWLGRGRKGAPRRLKFHDKRPLERRKVNFPWRSDPLYIDKQPCNFYRSPPPFPPPCFEISRWTRFENCNDRNKYVERPRDIFFFSPPLFISSCVLFYFSSRVKFVIHGSWNDL